MVKETSFLIQEVETAPAMEYFDVNQGTISTILGTNRPTSVPRGLLGPLEEEGVECNNQISYFRF